MNIFIPIIASLLFWLGGRDQMPVPWNQKLFRWVFLGAWLALCTFLVHPSVLAPLVLPCFFVATNVMGYGEKNWLRKLFGKDIQWILYGTFFGLASYFSLGILCIAQSVLATIVSYVLLKWSNDGFDTIPYLGKLVPSLYMHRLNQEWVEIGISLLGTSLYVFLK